MSSWFFGGTAKSNLPPITPLQEQRSKQIHSLKTLNPSLIELKRDVEYRLTLNSGGNNVALIIALPPHFPQDKPIVKVSPALSHPWVSKSLMVTGCPSLNNFGVHSDIGRVIQSIVQELRQIPPVVFSTAAPAHQQSTGISSAYQPYQPLSNNSHRPQADSALPRPGLQRSQQQQQPQPSLSQPSQPQDHLANHNSLSPGAVAAGFSSSCVPYSHSSAPPIDMVEVLGVEPTVPPTGLVNPGATYQPPPLSALFDSLQLNSKSMADLQQLYDNEGKIVEIIRDSAQVKQMLDDRSKLYEECEHLSETNLSYKPEVEKLKYQLLKKIEERNELKNKFDRNCLQQQGLNERFQPQNLLDNLRVSAAEAEQDSEKLADNFLGGQVPIEDFVKQYTELRKNLHLKKAKEEKLDHMVQKGAIRY